jgi:hypothetical protein
VLDYGARLLVAGCIIGLVGAFVLRWLLAAMLFGVSAGDPDTLVGAVIVLAVVALVACYLPARRANAVDPVVALRELTSGRSHTRVWLTAGARRRAACERNRTGHRVAPARQGLETTQPNNSTSR